jgi:hypothetical protein
VAALSEALMRWDHPQRRDNVCFHDAAFKDLHHPVVGDITLTNQRMDP